jgi:tripartite-type tricarboxylate transporter receptor subunit TctC
VAHRHHRPPAAPAPRHRDAGSGKVRHYTIILLAGGHAVSAALDRKLRFHPVDSFDFISLVGTFPFVVAKRADGPIGSLADVIATARQQPGKLSFSVGFGSTQHLTGELLVLSTGGKLTRVPYRGGI